MRELLLIHILETESQINGRCMMKNKSLEKMVETALLGALILVFSFTPIGYIKIGALSVTFVTIPVAVGAVIVGKGAGTILGLIFGITSFVQCFGIDPFGTLLAGINPFLTFVLCVGTRALMGFLVGLIFELMMKKPNLSPLKTTVANLCAPLLNSMLFLGALFIMFGNVEYEGALIKVLITTVMIINVPLEAAVVTVAGTAICIAMQKIQKFKEQ